MSKDQPSNHEPTAEEILKIQGQLDVAAAAERESILAEAEELGPLEGEEELMQSLLQHMEESDPPAQGKPAWGGLLGGFIGLVAAACLLVLFLDRSPDSKQLDQPTIPEGFALDGEGKLEILQPLGTVSEYGAFQWAPAGSLDLSARLTIWDDTPAGVGKPPLEWKGITDNELPFDPGVELPSKIRWQVQISNAQGQELLLSAICSAERLP